MIWPEPFGFLLVIALIVVALAVGLVVIVRGRKKWKRISLGCGIISAPWLLLILSAVLTPNIDNWNPLITSDERTWGLWERDDDTVELKADSTFTATLSGVSKNGTWKRDDFNLHLSPSTGSERYMRFVEHEGELLLLLDPPKGEPGRPGPIARRK